MAVEEELLQVLFERVVRPLYVQFQRNRASRTQKRLTAMEQRRMLYTRLRDTRRSDPEAESAYQRVEPDARRQITDRTFTQLTERIQQLQQEQQLTQELLAKYERDMREWVNRTDFNENGRDDHLDHDRADQELATDEGEQARQQQQQLDDQQNLQTAEEQAEAQRRREEADRQREAEQRRREQEERGEDPVLGTAVVAEGALAAADELDQQLDQEAEQQREAEPEPDWDSVTRSAETETEAQTFEANELDQSGQDLDDERGEPAQTLDQNEPGLDGRGESERGPEEGLDERGNEGSGEFLPTGQDERDAAQAAQQNGPDAQAAEQNGQGGQGAQPAQREPLDDVLDQDRAARADQQGPKEPSARRDVPVDQESAKAGLTGNRAPVAVAPVGHPEPGRPGETPGAAAARQRDSAKGRGGRGSDGGPELKR